MQNNQERLIRLAVQGDSAAITELYEDTYSGVYHTVRSMIRDEDTVLDIVQDSYIKGFQSLHTLDNPQAFPAWMKRIAINKTKDHLKRKSPLLFSEIVREEDDELPFRDEHLDHLPEEVLDRQETSRLIREILDTLSEDQRLVIGMYYYEDMTVQQIAALLDCSENTVKSRLRYGRKHIERKVKELEQQGTKLYSLAPIPFLLWLFRMDAQTPVAPSSLVLQKIQAGTFASAPKAADFGPAKVTAPQAPPPSSSAVAAGAAQTAGKSLAVKLLAGILAVAVVGGGAAAVLSSRGSEDTPAEEPPAITKEFSPENQLAQAAEAYQAVLEEYTSVCAMDSAAFLASPDQYFNGDHSSIFYYHTYHSHSFYNARYDIDGNGIPELLIGIQLGDTISITDLYGYDQGGAVQILDEPTLGDRSQIYLLSDGTLYFIGSSSAWETTHTYLKLNGTTLETVSASDAPEVTPPWEYLCGETQATQEETAPEASPEPAPPAQAAPASFDSILADIQTLCSIPLEEYEADPSYYDQQYRHLGTGIPWLLQSGRQTGAYTMCAWTGLLDVNGDGSDELCLGLGVSPSQVTPIAIYDSTLAVTEGDALYPILDAYGGFLPVEWTNCYG